MDALQKAHDLNARLVGDWTDSEIEAVAGLIEDETASKIVLPAYLFWLWLILWAIDTDIFKGFVKGLTGWIY